MNQGYVHEVFSEVATRMPEAVAIECAGGPFVTYRALEEESNRLANYLLGAGARKGSVVAVVAEETVTIVTAIIAALKAGCVFVPLDPRTPSKRLESLLAEVSPSFFVVEAGTLATLARAIEGTSAGAKIICPGGTGEDAMPAGLNVADDYATFQDTSRPRIEHGPDDMCYVYFTSGSTGKPKGIAGRLKAIDHFIRWEIETLGLEEGVRVSQLTTPSFDASLRDIFTPLCAGGTICAPANRDTVADARRLVAWLDERRVNLVHCVPSLFRSLLNEELNAAQLTALKYVLMSGEPLLPSDVRRWVSVYGERIQLVNLYGPSETTMVKFFHFVRPPDAERRAVPIGKPMEGAKAVLLDVKGKVCAPGSVGEIYIRTPYRTLGYLNQPELTAEVFLPSPFSNDPQDILYKTGDLGRQLEDGNFEFLGRKDQQVKIRGVRVELREIEDLLLRHPTVKDVAVVDRDDAEGGKYLCAYVVPDGETTTAALKEYLAEHLPEYLVPSAFVLMEALPRTLTGKVDRRVLPSPEQARAGGGREYVPPRTAVEEMLASVWAQVLKVERVGVEDNFFDLGGHSLLVTRLLSRVRTVLGVDLPMRRLFESPTVAGLAQAVEAARLAERGVQLPPLRPFPRGGRLPLSFAQQRLWFLDQLEPGSAFYNFESVVRIGGPLDTNALARSLNEIVRRHETLRTTFAVADGEPSQIVAAALEVELPVRDVRALSLAEGEAELHRAVEEELTRGFDLARGPLIRALLVRLADEEHILLFTMHHIISDAWSEIVFVRELTALYEAFMAGRPSPLAELPVQYADFAAWQREWLQGDVLEEQLSYWKQHLADAPVVIELPIDRPRPAAQTFRGARHLFTLPAPLSDALQALGRQEGTTLFMTLLAAFDALLHFYSRRSRIVVGTDVANRRMAETEGLIGFFINQLVLSTDVTGDPTFRELLARVRETALGAYEHQDLPFEKLVEAINPARNPQYSPLMQVKLVLQNVPVSVVEPAGLNFSPIEIERGTAQMDLIVNVREGVPSLAGFVEYNTDLFNASTIARLIEHFETLLGRVVNEPGARLSELVEMLAADDRRLRLSRERELEESRVGKLGQVRRRAIGSTGLKNLETT
ncbi:MAG: amino acid adenylation domain-containing protein [Pyrinomonadaceae bacterium]